MLLNMKNIEGLLKLHRYLRDLFELQVRLLRWEQKLCPLTFLTSVYTQMLKKMMLSYMQNNHHDGGTKILYNF